jgi:hypothetical protein
LSAAALTDVCATAAQAHDALLDAYSAALISAQMQRTPEAWIAVGEAWGSYFNVLLASDAHQYRERKQAIAERVDWASKKGLLHE